MDYWSAIFYKENNERADAILDKVKNGIWLFLEGEEIEMKRNFFLHKYGVLSWESKYGNPTPFIAEVEEEETTTPPLNSRKFKSLSQRKVTPSLSHKSWVTPSRRHAVTPS